MLYSFEFLMSIFVNWNFSGSDLVVLKVSFIIVFVIFIVGFFGNFVIVISFLV